MNATVKNQSTVPNFVLRQAAHNVTTVAFYNDVAVEVELFSGYLNIQVQLPPSYMGFTKGLLGNYNGNVSDEFVFRNGTTLDDQASDREIHQFSQSCKFVLIIVNTLVLNVLYRATTGQ